MVARSQVLELEEKVQLLTGQRESLGQELGATTTQLEKEKAKVESMLRHQEVRPGRLSPAPQLLCSPAACCGSGLSVWVLLPGVRAMASGCSSGPTQARLPCTVPAGQAEGPAAAARQPGPGARGAASQPGRGRGGQGQAGRAAGGEPGAERATATGAAGQRWHPACIRGLPGAGLPGEQLVWDTAVPWGCQEPPAAPFPTQSQSFPRRGTLGPGVTLPRGHLLPGPPGEDPSPSAPVQTSLRWFSPRPRQRGAAGSDSAGCSRVSSVPVPGHAPYFVVGAAASNTHRDLTAEALHVVTVHFPLPWDILIT